MERYTKKRNGHDEDDDTATRAAVHAPATDTPGQRPTDASSLPFERVSDGCICGKIAGGTWVASPKGTVSVPPGTDDATAQEICRVATNYYTVQNKERRARLKAPAATRGAERKTPAQSPAKRVGNQKAAAKGEIGGRVTWREMEAGGASGEAKHGTFTIATEGKKHALYFYDADGQSRHIQSGEASKLRKVAEEMTARGQPVPRPVSGVDDAALMRAFMGGAMEDDR